MVTDLTPLIEACRNKLQIALTSYTKKDGSVVMDHVGGIYEIRGDELWIWDTNRNDTIRKFFISSINDFQVLDIPFSPPHAWPIKIEGEIVG